MASRAAVAVLLTVPLIVLGSCGGDAGGPSAPPADNPVPILLSASPATLTAGAAATVTLKGSNFVASSRARWNDTDRPTKYVDAATITVDLTSADLANPTSGLLTVVNPSPGGGTSGLLDMKVVFPVPTITSITPTFTAPAEQVMIVVTGSGFVSTQSKVMWDGAIPLFVESAVSNSTSLTAYAIEPLIRLAGTHTITVVNPSPGGTSNAVDFTVRNPAPSITAIAPSPVVTGVGFTLDVNGAGFTRGSIVRWNGADRPTGFVNATTLAAEIPASDVASPTTATITVFNAAPGGGTSTPVALPVEQAPLSVTGTLTLSNFALVRDSTRGLLYASVPNTGGPQANSIVKIDPMTATIVASLPVGLDPGPMAISDDDRFLYVALMGAPSIVRVDLQTFAKDLEFGLGASAIHGSLYGGDLEVLPGSPRSLVVSHYNRCCSPHYEAVAVYDDGVPRPMRTGFPGPARIVRGPTASRLFGYNDQSTMFGFHPILVTPEGLQDEGEVLGLVNNFNVDIEYDGGFVYSTIGAVVNVGTMTRVGTISADGVAVRPDARNARVHFLANGAISTHHATTFARIGGYSNPALALRSTLVRWGDDGLAAGGNGSIVLLRGPLVKP